MRLQVGELGLKLRIRAGLSIRLIEFFERGHQDFGDEASAVWPKVSGGIRLRRHHACETASILSIKAACSKAAATNRRTLS